MGRARQRDQEGVKIDATPVKLRKSLRLLTLRRMARSGKGRQREGRKSTKRGKCRVRTKVRGGW